MRTLTKSVLSGAALGGLAMLGTPAARAQIAPGPSPAVSTYCSNTGGTAWIPCLPGSGGSGGSGAVYGQNGTAAMSTSNPFADNIVQFGGVAVSLGLKAATASIPTVDANFALTYAAGQATAPTGEQIIGGEYLATLPTKANGQVSALFTDLNGQLWVRDNTTENLLNSINGVVGTNGAANTNLRVTTAPPSSVPSAIAASLPALGATPTLIAAAGGITQGFTIQNNSTAVAFWSVTAAAGTTLTYLNAETLAVGASFTSPPNMPMGGALQVQSTTSTACTVSGTVGCIEGHYK